MVRITGFGNSTFRTQSIPEVPLPASLGLFGTAIALTSIMRRKQTT
jgi:hypothetical protein